MISVTQEHGQMQVERIDELSSLAVEAYKVDSALVRFHFDYYSDLEAVRCDGIGHSDASEQQPCQHIEAVKEVLSA